MIFSDTHSHDRSPIKVLLATRWTLDRDAARNVFEEFGDVSVVDRSPDPVELLLTAREERPDVVIIDLDKHSNLPGVATHLRAELCDLSFIGIPEDGASLHLFPAFGQIEIIGSVDSPSLVRALRRIVEISGRDSF